MQTQIIMVQVLGLSGIVSIQKKQLKVYVFNLNKYFQISCGFDTEALGPKKLGPKSDTWLDKFETMDKQNLKKSQQVADEAKQQEKMVVSVTRLHPKINRQGECVQQQAELGNISQPSLLLDCCLFYFWNSSQYLKL